MSGSHFHPTSTMETAVNPDELMEIEGNTQAVSAVDSMGNPQDQLPFLYDPLPIPDDCFNNGLLMQFSDYNTGEGDIDPFISWRELKEKGFQIQCCYKGPEPCQKVADSKGAVTFPLCKGCRKKMPKDNLSQSTIAGSQVILKKDGEKHVCSARQGIGRRGMEFQIKRALLDNGEDLSARVSHCEDRIGSLEDWRKTFGGADLAYYYKVSPHVPLNHAITPGTVVKVTVESSELVASPLSFSDRTPQSDIVRIGVVPSRPYMVCDSDLENRGRELAVAIMGRVPVKIDETMTNVDGIAPGYLLYASFGNSEGCAIAVRKSDASTLPEHHLIGEVEKVNVPVEYEGVELDGHFVEAWIHDHNVAARRTAREEMELMEPVVKYVTEMKGALGDNSNNRNILTLEVAPVSGSLSHQQRNTKSESITEAFEKFLPKKWHEPSQRSSSPSSSSQTNKIETSQRVFLLLGDSGAGKSTCLLSLYSKLLHSWEGFSDWIPIFKRIPDMDDRCRMLQDAQFGHYFDDRARDALKEKHRFVFILDGYNECSNAPVNMYVANKLREWPHSKVVIACQKKYVTQWPNHRMFFEPNHDDFSSTGRGLVERELQPLRRSQQSEIVTLLGEDAQDVQHNLRCLPISEDLLRNPWTLKLVVMYLHEAFQQNVLSEVSTSDNSGFFMASGVANPSERTRSVLTVFPHALYKFYIRKWEDKAVKRCTDQNIWNLIGRATNPEGPNEPVDFSKILKKFSQMLAKSMHVTTSSRLAPNLVGELWNDEMLPLIGADSESEKWFHICTATAPLSSRFSFAHQTIRDTIVVDLMVEEILSCSADMTDSELKQRFEVFGARTLSNFGDMHLLRHLGDRLKEETERLEVKRVGAHPDLELPVSLLRVHNPPEKGGIQHPIWNGSIVQGLFRIVDLSKRVSGVGKGAGNLFEGLKKKSGNHDPDWQLLIAASSNSVTCLSLSGAVLEGLDWRNVRIPQCDLAFGHLRKTNLENSDVSGANFQLCDLRGTKVKGAKASDVYFGQPDDIWNVFGPPLSTRPHQYAYDETCGWTIMGVQPSSLLSFYRRNDWQRFLSSQNVRKSEDQKKRSRDFFQTMELSPNGLLVAVVFNDGVFGIYYTDPATSVDKCRSAMRGDHVKGDRKASATSSELGHGGKCNVKQGSEDEFDDEWVDEWDVDVEVDVEVERQGQRQPSDKDTCIEEDDWRDAMEEAQHTPYEFDQLGWDEEYVNFEKDCLNTPSVDWDGSVAHVIEWGRSGEKDGHCLWVAASLGTESIQIYAQCDVEGKPSDRYSKDSVGKLNHINNINSDKWEVPQPPLFESVASIAPPSGTQEIKCLRWSAGCLYVACCVVVARAESGGDGSDPTETVDGVHVSGEKRRRMLLLCLYRIPCRSPSTPSASPTTGNDHPPALVSWMEYTLDNDYEADRYDIGSSPVLNTPETCLRQTVPATTNGLFCFHPRRQQFAWARRENDECIISVVEFSGGVQKPVQHVGTCIFPTFLRYSPMGRILHSTRDDVLWDISKVATAVTPTAPSPSPSPTSASTPTPTSDNPLAPDGVVEKIPNPRWLCELPQPLDRSCKPTWWWSEDECYIAIQRVSVCEWLDGSVANGLVEIVVGENQSGYGLMDGMVVNTLRGPWGPKKDLVLFSNKGYETRQFPLHHYFLAFIWSDICFCGGASSLHQSTSSTTALVDAKAPTAFTLANTLPELNGIAAVTTSSADGRWLAKSEFGEPSINIHNEASMAVAFTISSSVTCDASDVTFVRDMVWSECGHCLAVISSVTITIWSSSNGFQSPLHRELSELATSITAVHPVQHSTRIGFVWERRESLVYVRLRCPFCSQSKPNVERIHIPFPRAASIVAIDSIDPCEDDVDHNCSLVAALCSDGRVRLYDVHETEIVFREAIVVPESLADNTLDLPDLLSLAPSYHHQNPLLSKERLLCSFVDSNGRDVNVSWLDELLFRIERCHIHVASFDSVDIVWQRRQKQSGAENTGLPTRMQRKMDVGAATVDIRTKQLSRIFVNYSLTRSARWRLGMAWCGTFSIPNIVTSVSGSDPRHGLLWLRMSLGNVFVYDRATRKVVDLSSVTLVQLDKLHPRLRCEDMDWAGWEDYSEQRCRWFLTHGAPSDTMKQKIQWYKRGAMHAGKIISSFLLKQ